jgi:flagellin
MGLRINHNLASLGAALNLGKANSALSSSLAKLSTGLKINTAADGPADLIISEKFRSQINAISKATENTQNAISMLSTAEGALAEVNSLLSKMQGLALKATQTGTQSPDEIAASQAEIDAALESINSISRNTSFGSINLLDGSQEVETESVDTQNILVDIDKANFAGDKKSLNVNVVNAATRASTAIDFSAGAQGDADGTDGILSNTQVLKVTGSGGSDTMTFSAGSAIADVAAEINSRVTQTGVYAEVSDSKLVLSSAEYGASEFVTVEDVDGNNDLLDIAATAATTTTDNTTYEVDLTAAGGLGQEFTIGGATIRSLGQFGDKYNGYTVKLDIGTAANNVAVNDDAKIITIAATSAATATNIENLLSTETNTSWSVTGNDGGYIFQATDATTTTVGEIRSNLVVTAKAGAASHAEAAKLSITYGGNESATYDAATNTLTLDLVSTVYSAGGLSAVINADTAIAALFDLKMPGGADTIDRTSTGRALTMTKVDVDTGVKSMDLRTDPGMGMIFNAGDGSNMAFKLTGDGASRYGDYTVTYKQGQAAQSVSVDHASKTIAINANAAATNTTIIASLVAATNLGASTVTSTGYYGVGATVVDLGTTVTKSFVTDASGLIVTTKENSSTSFNPKIEISAASAAAAIAYNSTTQVITLTLNHSAAANPVDTQSEFDTLLNNSAAGAKLRTLFNFEVTGAVQGTTLKTVTIGEGGGASGSGITNTNAIKSNGTDGVLEVNGVKTAASNLTFTFDNGNIRGHITIDESFNTAGKNTSFTIAGKGAFLQMGSKAQLSHQTGVGIQSVATDQLATGLYLDTNMSTTESSYDNGKLYTTATLADISSGGEFDLAKNSQTAYKIISQAITEVSVARSKLGALVSNTLESNINSLGVAFENLTAAESRIRDVDFAAETAEFTRAQILVQAGTSVAAQANVATQAALQLLG